MRTTGYALEIRKESILPMTALLGIAVAAPLLIKQQLITGSIVNATLIIAAALLGTTEGLVVGLLPSCIALATGLLPVALAPMVPFIILGNVALVLAVSYLGRLNYWVGVVSGSLLKFALLYGTSSLVIGLLFHNQLASAVASMMSLPQLITAIIGGIMAFAVVKVVKKIS